MEFNLTIKQYYAKKISKTIGRQENFLNTNCICRLKYYCSILLDLTDEIYVNHLMNLSKMGVVEILILCSIFQSNLDVPMQFFNLFHSPPHVFPENNNVLQFPLNI